MVYISPSFQLHRTLHYLSMPLMQKFFSHHPQGRHTAHCFLVHIHSLGVHIPQYPVLTLHIALHRSPSIWLQKGQRKSYNVYDSSYRWRARWQGEGVGGKGDQGEAAYLGHVTSWRRTSFARNQSCRWPLCPGASLLAVELCFFPALLALLETHPVTLVSG